MDRAASLSTKAEAGVRWGVLITIALFAYALLACLSSALTARMNHDEHQFLTSAFMVAKQGLHPYRDFAYFHMPNLVYLYAPLWFAPHPFVLARGVVGLCGFGICIALYRHGRSILTGHGDVVSLVAPSCAVVLLASSPLFGYAASRVWNHTPSMLMALASVGFHCRALKSSTGQARWFFASGVCLGMAIGIRLSCATLVVPFVFAIVAFSSTGSRGMVRHVAAFALGGACANVLGLFFLTADFDAFWFGNLGYAELNTRFREATGYGRAMTFAAKLEYVNGKVLGLWAERMGVFAAIYAHVLLVVAAMQRRSRISPELVFVWLTLPFVLVGALVATPAWRQYFSPLVPFSLLAALHSLGAVRPPLPGRALALVPIVVLSLAAVSGSQARLSRFVETVVTDPTSLAALQVGPEADSIAREVREAPAGGPAVTLAPLYAALAGVPIDPRFATGPFAFRVSHLLPEAQALARGLPLRKRLGQTLRANPPRLILTGYENEALDAPLVKAASALGYVRKRTAFGHSVWLRP